MDTLKSEDEEEKFFERAKNNIIFMFSLRSSAVPYAAPNLEINLVETVEKNPPTKRTPDKGELF